MWSTPRAASNCVSLNRTAVLARNLWTLSYVLLIYVKFMQSKGEKEKSSLNKDTLQFQLRSVTHSCLTLCDPMDCPTHVHRVSDAISSSVVPFSCPQSFTESGSFPMSQLFSSGDQSQLQHQSFQGIFRTDFLQDGLVGSPCSPRDSQESSPTAQFKSINFSALGFLCSPALTSIHDYWKNHSFDYMDCYLFFCLSPKFIYGNLILNVMILGDEVFGRLSGHECRIPMNGINDLYKRGSESTLVPSAMLRTQLSEPRSAPFSPDTRFTSNLILRLPASELWEINFCCL